MYTRMQKEILPFVTQYNPSVPNLKHILMEIWHLIESQPKLKEKFKEPPIMSYKRGISLRDILVLILPGIDTLEIHYTVNDKTGAGIIIEFTNRGRTVYENTVGVTFLIMLNSTIPHTGLCIWAEMFSNPSVKAVICLVPQAI